ncbi:histidine kinase, partial [Chroococcidiopsis cubana CCALA 043]
MQRPRPETVTLDDILITEEISRRSPRPPNWQAEAQAMQPLARQMARDSESLLQTLVEITLELCLAGTAGVSLLETSDEEEVFRWSELAGRFTHDGLIPRNFSPCGVCVDRGTPQFFSHPERYFTYLQDANTPIVEALLLPLIADDHAFGAIWIMSHDEQRHFDAEDVRVMTSLADFTAAALLLKQQQTRELLAINAALEAKVEEHRQAEDRARALISNLPGGAAFVVDRDLRYLLAEGEALSAAGFKPKDFIRRTIFEVLPPELTTNYEMLYRKALAGESFEHEHNAHDRFYISRGKPLRSPNNEVYAVLAVSYDISDRKIAEAAIAADLKDTQLLRDLSARLVTEDDIQAIYQEIVATAIALTRADAGSIQILDEATQELVLLTTQGFERNMIDRFYRVNAGSNTPCGMALTTGERTFVDFDVPESEDPHAEMRLHREEGYLSAQSTPLIARSGKAIGMVSTHWRKHHRPSDRELRFLDLLARQAADLIEQRQAEAALRESEAHFRALANASSDIVYRMSADWCVMYHL